MTHYSDFPIDDEMEELLLRLMEAEGASEPRSITLAHIYNTVLVKNPESEYDTRWKNVSWAL